MMKGHKNRHGFYVLDKSYYPEHIHIARLLGSWNLETARDVMREQERLFVSSFSDEQWAGIADMTGWKSATPEALDVVNSAVVGFVELGFRFHAVIASPHMTCLQESIAESTSELELEIYYVDSEEEALAWCRAKLAGLKSK